MQKETINIKIFFCHFFTLLPSASPTITALAGSRLSLSKGGGTNGEYANLTNLYCALWQK